MSLAADIAAVKALPGISSVEFDEPLLSFEYDGDSYSIQVPDGYPKAPAEYYGPVNGTVKAGTLQAMIEEIAAKRQREPAHEQDDGMAEEQRTVSSEDMSRQDSAQVSGELEVDFNKLAARRDVYDPSCSIISAQAKVKWLMAPTELISTSVAKAWGIDTQVPIKVSFKTSSMYRESTKPATVEFVQNDKKFPFGQQMARIVDAYLARHWNNRTFPTVPPVAPAVALAVTDKKSSSNKDDIRAPRANVFQALQKMGYQVELASRAARRCETVEAAVAWLAGKHDDDDHSAEVNAASDSVAAGALILDPALSQHNPDTDPNKVVAFEPTSGLLCHIVDFIKKRTPTVSKYCVLCDQPHRFSNHMIRPAVCSRDMCVFQFQEMHIGSDSAESVATDAGVIDLLLTIFRSAAVSSRASNILLPFPSVADPRNPKVLALDPAKPDLHLVQKVLKNFPMTKDVVRCSDLVALKTQLERTEPLAYPLLEWVIASNRSHLIRMDQRACLPKMSTEHQFLLLTAPPEIESVFRAGKSKHGTKFAFHGSRCENWHGILRNGLKNMSGTANQVNGNAHGSGIYFAPNANTSIGYSGGVAAAAPTAQQQRDAFLSESMLCIALCEIVNDGCIKDHGWCWTVENEQNVMTRFLFVYTSAPSATAGQASTTDDAFLCEINKAMKFYAL